MQSAIKSDVRDAVEMVKSEPLVNQEVGRQVIGTAFDEALEDIEFGAVFNQDLPNTVLKLSHQYTIHAVKNADGENILVANVHLPSGSSTDKIMNWLSDIISDIQGFRQEYDFQNFVIGGDINIPLYTGSDKPFSQGSSQDVEKYRKNIDEVKSNVSSILKLLSEYQGIRFRVDLPTEAYLKERRGDNLLDNAQAMAKGGISSQGTEIVIQAGFFEGNEEKPVRIFRGNREYSEHANLDDFYFCREPIPFDVLNPKGNFDHQIMKVMAFGLSLAFVNVLETSLSSIKGVAESSYVQNPADDLGVEWTNQVKALARQIAVEVNPKNKGPNNEPKKDKLLILESEDHKVKFIEKFVSEFWSLGNTQTLVALLKEKKNDKDKVNPQNIRTAFDKKIDKKLREGKPCEVHRAITQLGQMMGCPPLGGFVQSESYHEALAEMGRPGLTQYIEELQAARIQKECGDCSVVFMSECIKDDLRFKKAKLPILDFLAGYWEEKAQLFKRNPVEPILESKPALSFSGSGFGSVPSVPSIPSVPSVPAAPSEGPSDWLRELLNSLPDSPSGAPTLR